jgi:hypothetical protein
MDSISRRKALLCTAASGLALMSDSLALTTAPVVAEAGRLPGTFSHIGKERDISAGNTEMELFHREGAGCLTHMWFAMDLRTRIRIYVDGESEPSIDMALDLGHGFAKGGPPEPWGVRQFGRTGGVHNSYRIPFARGIRVTSLPAAINRDGRNRKVWWIIRGSEGLRAALGDFVLPENARLRLHRLEGYTAKPLEEFDIASTMQSGVLYQMTLLARGQQLLGTWEDQSYQECCVRAYLNGSSEPTFLSSGLEDYFASSGYFHHRTLFQNEVSGLTYLNLKDNEFCAYRFHDLDPVFFSGGLRLSLRCGESLEGHQFYRPPSATYTAYTWIYGWD